MLITALSIWTGLGMGIMGMGVCLIMGMGNNKTLVFQCSLYCSGVYFHKLVQCTHACRCTGVPATSVQVSSKKICFGGGERSHNGVLAI